MFSSTWHLLHVFPRLAPVVCFPALGTRCVFSRAWHPLCVFLRLAPVVCFPALGTRCVFSCARHSLQVFPCAGPVVCFPAFGICYAYSRSSYLSCSFASSLYQFLILFALYLFPALKNIASSLIFPIIWFGCEDGEGINLNCEIRLLIVDCLMDG